MIQEIYERGNHDGTTDQKPGIIASNISSDQFTPKIHQSTTQGIPQGDPQKRAKSAHPQKPAENRSADTSGHCHPRLRTCRKRRTWRMPLILIATRCSRPPTRARREVWHRSVQTGLTTSATTRLESRDETMPRLSIRSLVLPASFPKVRDCCVFLSRRFVAPSHIPFKLKCYAD